MTLQTPIGLLLNMVVAAIFCKQNKLLRGEMICPQPIVADVRPCVDGSTVRTALVADLVGLRRVSVQLQNTWVRMD